ncbi:MAG: aminotransferase class III-fold pyridoxal phosphate-dependent enzyme [Proteobacteria bacterium]|nr:aminotransferase class III-fold pyridoxal phosphate-dependent enzyme [Pseudomonadota bacterium]
MKKVALIQARMGSTRFPGKVLELLGTKPVLQWVVEAASRISIIDQVIVVTSDEQGDQKIVDWCQQHLVDVFRGSEGDVLDRFYQAALTHQADVIMRITADCPFLDHHIASQVLALVSTKQADYASNVLPATWPDGLDCEAFTFEALKKASINAKKPSDREHVTSYICNNRSIFNSMNVSCPMKGLEKHRWTIDTLEDLEYLNKIVSSISQPITTWSILEIFQRYPELEQPTSKRNEGFERSLQEEVNICTNFERSNKLLKRALDVIPIGTQTFSKSHIQYPENSPMYITHGMGSRVWDVDGNEYIDCVSGLLPIILGYNDHDINWAIQDQLNRGITFSLATELEIELAETLCDLIPSAEKVRFAKNGTDVTSAAVRLARAYTKRDKVIVCGYHGWQDWSIGTTTRNKGVPKAVADLSISIPYNDLNIVEKLLKSYDYACLILESCNIVAPHDDYLARLKSLCEQYGSLLIFDEVITGFRFALGGAQEYFGVTPHLSCFGKAMGNGMPISAVVGQNEFMKKMEEIFFSGTFGGEALSLAASLETIRKIKAKSVIPYLWEYGADLASILETTIKEFSLQDIITLNGFAPWKIFGFHDVSFASSLEIKTLFIQEMLKRGILINSSFNITYSHNTLDKMKIQHAFEEVCSIISKGIKNQNILGLLSNLPIKPLFKVRQ